MNASELAKFYYPTLWSKERLKALVSAGKLSKEDYAEITGGDSE